MSKMLWLRNQQQVTKNSKKHGHSEEKPKAYDGTINDPDNGDTRKTKWRIIESQLLVTAQSRGQWNVNKRNNTRGMVMISCPYQFSVQYNRKTATNKW